jgi:hypothetical protein
MASDATFQLVYVSAAKATFSPAALGQLLMKSRVNNHRVGVSGILVHHAGSFFQVLEGHRDVVETLFRRISIDPRHHRIQALLRQSVAQPSFGDWSMGFVEGAQRELGGLPGFNDFFRRGFELTEVSGKASSAKELLLAFRAGRFRQFVDV